MIGILDLSRKFMFGCFDHCLCHIDDINCEISGQSTFYFWSLNERLKISTYRRHAGTDIYLCGDPKRCPVCLGPGIRYPVNISRHGTWRDLACVCADTAHNPLSACPLYPLCPLRTPACSSYKHCPQTVPTPEILAIVVMAMFNKLPCSWRVIKEVLSIDNVCINHGIMGTNRDPN